MRQPCLLVQYEALESACIKYLCSQLQNSSHKLLLQIALLADRLGLGNLCTAAARIIVQLPWDAHSPKVSAVARLACFYDSSARLDSLLHDPRTCQAESCRQHHQCAVDSS